MPSMDGIKYFYVDYHRVLFIYEFWNFRGIMKPNCFYTGNKSQTHRKQTVISQ